MTKTDQKYNIICLSNQLWDFPLWTNKRHVMSRMPKLGHRVLFVDPPINLGRVFLRNILKGKWSLSRIISQIKTTKEGVTVFTPINTHTVSEKYSKSHSKRINILAENTFKDNGNKTILWIYHVEIKGLENYLKNIKHDILVYDCVDNYEGFPKYDTPEKRRWVAEQERLLASRANVVFSTTPGLTDKLKRFNPRTYFTPNVGDYERFFDIKNKGFDLPEDLKKIRKPVVGFTGAVDEYKFDKDLFRKCAKENPNYSFVIIGPMALKDRSSSKKELGFDGLSNVYFLGTKEYSELPKYLAHFDVMTIPYQLNDYTIGGCFPVKFLDYLAAGLPTVVTDLPTYVPFDKVCYISKSYESFSHNIRIAVEENSVKKEKQRQEVAKVHTWDGKVSNMINLINECQK